MLTEDVEKMFLMEDKKHGDNPKTIMRWCSHFKDVIKIFDFIKDEEEP